MYENYYANVDAQEDSRHSPAECSAESAVGAIFLCWCFIQLYIVITSHRNRDVVCIDLHLFPFCHTASTFVTQK